ncbi:hypothetical protein [Streptomyces sp. C11-1]|uniref:hypothetical protein n=1 Tax=Streptomyces sp. C11-1 TaxID=3444503 RepID=UPI0037D9B470
MIDSHGSDRIFLVLRRALGLRLELLVLMVAEVPVRHRTGRRPGVTFDAPAVGGGQSGYPQVA